MDNGYDGKVTYAAPTGAKSDIAPLLKAGVAVDGAEIAEKLNYTPNSGGGEAVPLLIGGKVSAGISGVGEFAQHIESGALKALAVSSEEPVSQLPDVPTITEEGYDVVLTNWRGVIAPGGISDGEKDELVRVITELHESEAWTAQLETKGWTDAFLVGVDFDEFLTGNIEEVTATLKNIGLVQ